MATNEFLIMLTSSRRSILFAVLSYIVACVVIFMPVGPLWMLYRIPIVAITLILGWLILAAVVSSKRRFFSALVCVVPIIVFVISCLDIIDQYSFCPIEDGYCVL